MEWSRKRETSPPARRRSIPFGKGRYRLTIGRSRSPGEEADHDSDFADSIEFAA